MYFNSSNSQWFFFSLLLFFGGGLHAEVVHIKDIFLLKCAIFLDSGCANLVHWKINHMQWKWSWSKSLFRQMVGPEAFLTWYNVTWFCRILWAILFLVSLMLPAFSCNDFGRILDKLGEYEACTHKLWKITLFYRYCLTCHRSRRMLITIYSEILNRLVQTICTSLCGHA